jgi:serine/threonine protein kinase
MHECHVIHGGLRPDSILIDSRLRPQVSPFSISRYSRPDNFISDFLNGQCPCNWIFIAPEQMQGWNENPEVVVYSYGMILYEIITRRPIEESLPKGFCGFDILNGKRPPIPASVNRNWRMLIEHCWGMNPDDRPTFREIIDKCNGDYFWTIDSRLNVLDEYQQMIIKGLGRSVRSIEEFDVN